MNFSRVIAHGCLSHAPAISWTDKGTMQVSFGLLIEKPGHEAGQVFKTYVPCLGYGRVAERIGELGPASVVLIEGELSWRAGSKDGTSQGGLRCFAPMSRLSACHR